MSQEAESSTASHPTWPRLRHSSNSAITYPLRGTSHTQAFLELGYHISFAGNVTYRSNVKLVEALKTVPLDRLLLETDSPYLAPVPVRGRVNTPLNISYTYEFVAAVKGVDVESLDATVRENFYSIIR